MRPSASAIDKIRDKIRKKAMKQIVLILLVLCAIAGVVLSQEGQPARTLDRVNVRVNGDQTAAVITQLAINTDVIVEARKRMGNWVLVRTGAEKLHGFTLWNLLVLQVLDMFRLAA